MNVKALWSCSVFCTDFKQQVWFHYPWFWHGSWIVTYLCV